jgi:hypothetical protein
MIQLWGYENMKIYLRNSVYEPSEESVFLMQVHFCPEMVQNPESNEHISYTSSVPCYLL